MKRTMTAETLQDYLSSANMTIMLCRAHADNFSLDAEQVADAHWRIELHINELEGLRNDLSVHNVPPAMPVSDKVVRLPLRR